MTMLLAFLLLGLSIFFRATGHDHDGLLLLVGAIVLFGLAGCTQRIIDAIKAPRRHTHALPDGHTTGSNDA